MIDRERGGRDKGGEEGGEEEGIIIHGQEVLH